jgi:hypothetical protein
MIACSIVVTIKYVFDEINGCSEIKSHVCKINNNARLWLDVTSAQLYADRLRKKIENSRFESVSILIVPGII